MDNLIEFIKNKDYKLDRFPTGLKNNVSRIIIGGEKVPFVLKQFPKKKPSDIADLYESEKKALMLFANLIFIPNLHFYNDDERFLIMDYKHGINLEILASNSSRIFYNGLEEAISKLFEFHDYSKSLGQDEGFRKINLKIDLQDGLRILAEHKQILLSDKLLAQSNKMIGGMRTNENLILSHGCFSPGNILYNLDSGNISFIDFEMVAKAPIFYDLGFLVSRINLSCRKRKKLILKYLQPFEDNSNNLLEEVDLYMTIINVLRMGLDTETVNSGNDPSGIYLRRIRHSFNIFNSPISKNKEVISFIKIFNSSIIGEYVR